MILEHRFPGEVFFSLVSSYTSTTVATKSQPRTGLARSGVYLVAAKATRSASPKGCGSPRARCFAIQSLYKSPSRRIFAARFLSSFCFFSLWEKGSVAVSRSASRGRRTPSATAVLSCFTSFTFLGDDKSCWLCAIAGLVLPSLLPSMEGAEEGAREVAKPLLLPCREGATSARSNFEIATLVSSC